MPTFRALRRLAAVALAACSLVAVGVAQATSHALIMTISDYDDAKFPSGGADLPGVAIDARRAVEIAGMMGVPLANVQQLRDGQLTLEGIRRAMRDFTSRVQPGERAFIFYAGHGSQVPGSQSGRCAEGLVTHDAKLYFDHEIQRALEQLGQKAAQVVGFNDSCFSGGAAAKSRSAGERAASSSRFRPRAYPYIEGFRPERADESGYTCGTAINERMRSATQAANRSGARVVYIAGAAETEVTYESASTGGGGVATSAWMQCLRSASSDRDRSGAITGEELQGCAQALVDQTYADEPRMRHRITVIGDARLPLGFVDTQASVSARPLLEDIRSRADPSFNVELRLSSSRLRTNVDFLDFTVQGNRSGYLYLLYVAPGSNEITVLFPNDIDKDNRIEGGRAQRYPRPGWAIRSQHTGNDGQLLAVIADTPQDFTSGAMRAGPFATAAASARVATRLGVVTSRYGASAVQTVIQQP